MPLESRGVGGMTGQLIGKLGARIEQGGRYRVQAGRFNESPGLQIARHTDQPNRLFGASSRVVPSQSGGRRGISPPDSCS
jgi:hypothetical protein